MPRIITRLVLSQEICQLIILTSGVGRGAKRHAEHGFGKGRNSHLRIGRHLDQGMRLLLLKTEGSGTISHYRFERKGFTIFAWMDGNL